MLRRRSPSKGTAKVRHGAARRGGRIALAGALASISGGVLLASVAVSGPAVAATNSSVACGDVYGPKGLVAAINAANANGGGTISLAGGCTYTLTTRDNSDNGLPVVTSALTVNGNGATIARSQAPGTPSFRIFDNQGSLTLTVLTLTGGNPRALLDGGGILNEANATVNLTSSQIVHSSGDFGGAIMNRTGTVRVTGGGLDDNSARVGGAIYNQGSVTLTSSRVDDNTVTSTARGGGVGGGGIANFASVTLTSTQIKGNTATRSEPGSTFPTQGGGIENFSSATLNLTASQVSDNTVNPPGASGQGGGIFNSGSATLRASGVTGNVVTGRAAAGGGIFNNSGSVSLDASPVLANSPDNCAPFSSVAGCFG